MSGSPTGGPSTVARANDPSRYQVGDLLIDTGRQRVTRGDEVIALPKLSYDLLLALVRAAPNLHSLDALMELVWPKAVVSPETVSQRIKLLRDALGDDPRSPRYIEGLRGRGYRLIPSVTFESAPPLEPSPVNDGVVSAPAVVIPLTVPDPAIATVVPSDLPTKSSPASANRWPMWRWIGIASAALLAVVLVGHRYAVKPLQSGTSVVVAAAQPQSVAVLPFDNLSAEPNNDFIAVGIADSVLHQLASSPELIVISRSSSFALGKPAPEPREAGRRLGVRYLVGGSVQRAGKVLRVTAQLIDTSTNVEIWSLKLDRTLDEVFALQDQIAQRVAKQLDATIQSRSLGYAQYGTDAGLAFLKGRALIESRKVNDVEAAVQQFSAALQLAPTFAAAMTELARAKYQLASLRSDAQVQLTALWPEFDSLLNRAIEIDPGAGEAYFLRASRNLDGGDSRAVEADFNKGLELSPNYGPGLRDYANYLVDHGRYDDGLELIDRARLVEPLSAENHYRKGEILRRGEERRLADGEKPSPVAKRLADAAALYLQALSVQPEFYPAYTRLAQMRWFQGRLAEAIKYAEQSVAIEPAVGWTRQRLIWLYVDLGDVAAARDLMRGYVQGAPEIAPSEALLCFRAGNSDRAAAILTHLFSNPNVEPAGFATYIAPYALIEKAITDHDASPARRFLTEIPGLEKARGTLDVAADNFPWVAQLASLEHAAGNRTMGNDLAERIANYMETNERTHAPNIAGWDDWARAVAEGVLGHDEAALAHLEKLERLDQRIGWWARIERDPAFAAVRNTPRFQAIISSSKRWLEGEVRQVEVMRERGQIPRRSPQGLSQGGC